MLGLAPGKSVKILLSCNLAPSRYYMFPRWYVGAPGQQPLIIKSTDDDDLNFVARFDNVKQWKRIASDEWNPFSLQQRFEK